MGIKHKMLKIILAGIFIVPQVVFASWWNPISWNIWNIFKSTKTETVQVVQSIATTTKNINVFKIENQTKQKSKNDGKQPSKEAEKLKKDTEALKEEKQIINVSQPINQQKSQEASKVKNKNSIVNLPNGSVVEMDINGNITRTIKEVSNQIQTKIVDISNQVQTATINHKRALELEQIAVEKEYQNEIVRLREEKEYKINQIELDYNDSYKHIEESWKALRPGNWMYYMQDDINLIKKNHDESIKIVDSDYNQKINQLKLEKTNKDDEIKKKLTDLNY